MLRLAHWAPGAVLADDMGLGKTVQTIAVLLARAEQPSLVVVPGLLGSASPFRERFVVPIEGRGDAQRRRHLSRLVAPFVLRRTKRVVASELPDRTEIVHRVVLSSQERSLYDRTRLASLARLESAGQGKRMQILEELLRLRKLACHPRLFDATSTVPSSKLKAVRRLVSDV